MLGKLPCDLVDSLIDYDLDFFLWALSIFRIFLKNVQRLITMAVPKKIHETSYM